MIRDAASSRIAWLAACLHAVWFVLAVAGMSPPSPELAAFFDQGGGSSATLFAGRPFHFHYESIGLKVLMILDIPAVFSLIPLGIVLSPLSWIHRPNAYEASYLEALLALFAATVQWLIVGRKCEQAMSHRFPEAHRALSRSTPILIAALILGAVVLAPIVNERRRAEGFKHGGISLR